VRERVEPRTVETPVQALAVERGVEVASHGDVFLLEGVVEEVAGDAEALRVEDDREILARSAVAGVALLEREAGLLR
jgi:hypothetical protein